MTGRYDDVRRILREADSADPSPLLSWPNPDGPHRWEEPVEVCLDAWALAWARRLHEAAGDLVEIRLGAFGYPGDKPLPVPDADKVLRALARRDRKRRSGRPARPESTTALSVTWDVPVIESGHSLVHRVLVHNHTGVDVSLETNGFLEMRIVDADGRRVGGAVGPQQQPLRYHGVPANGSAEVPVIVGTASTVADLGYALPAGDWVGEVLLEATGAK